MDFGRLPGKKKSSPFSAVTGAKGKDFMRVANGSVNGLAELDLLCLFRLEIVLKVIDVVTCGIGEYAAL